MEQLPEDNQGAPVKVLVTGMSGTGKSTVLGVLSQHGHRVLDTDSNAWSRWVTLPDGSPDWVWREDKIAQVLQDHHSGSLFVAGCKSNQGQFYQFFDHIVLLTAPQDVILARIAARTTNPYGKSSAERRLIIRHVSAVEPLLRATATCIIDASAPLDVVVRQLEDLVSLPS